MIIALTAIALLTGQQDNADVMVERSQRLAALIADGDCAGAHGAVFVGGDRAMLEWVERACPMGSTDVARWDEYRPADIEGMFTPAQIRTARALARGEEVPVSTEPYDPAEPPAGD